MLSHLLGSWTLFATMLCLRWFEASPVPVGPSPSDSQKEFQSSFSHNLSYLSRHTVLHCWYLDICCCSSCCSSLGKCWKLTWGTIAGERDPSQCQSERLFRQWQGTQKRGLEIWLDMATQKTINRNRNGPQLCTHAIRPPSHWVKFAWNKVFEGLRQHGWNKCSRPRCGLILAPAAVMQ